MAGARGGVGQVRESAAGLTRLAKGRGMIVLLVGVFEGEHWRVEVLEHIVDASLLLDGDNAGRFRTLRAREPIWICRRAWCFCSMTSGLREVKIRLLFFESSRMLASRQVRR